MNFRISDQMMDTKQPQVFSSWSEAGTRSIQPADGSTDFFFWSFAQNHCLPRKTRENHCVYISKSEKCPDFPVGMAVRADANARIIVAGWLTAERRGLGHAQLNHLTQQVQSKTCTLSWEVPLQARPILTVWRTSRRGGPLCCFHATQHTENGNHDSQAAGTN
jgi:hypothetical protein